jgi:hypothetical protein
VPHVVESIEVGRIAAAAFEKWMEFEGFEPFLDALKRIRMEGARLDWRAEVLTVVPLDDTALVRLRIDYDALGASEDVRRALGAVSRRLQNELARFKAFSEAGELMECGAGFGYSPGAPPRA